MKAWDDVSHRRSELGLPPVERNDRVMPRGHKSLEVEFKALMKQRGGGSKHSRKGTGALFQTTKTHPVQRKRHRRAANRMARASRRINRGGAK
jgi:hypothetical protein